jgi:hypothetical protein
MKRERERERERESRAFFPDVIIFWLMKKSRVKLEAQISSMLPFNFMS